MIKKKDLKDSNGDYYRISGDLAVFVPMIEMCGEKRIKRITKILYVYNNINPLCDFRIHKEEQKRIKNEIIQKSVYDEVV